MVQKLAVQKVIFWLEITLWIFTMIYQTNARLAMFA